jgi:hypothetical protein
MLIGRHTTNIGTVLLLLKIDVMQIGVKDIDYDIGKKISPKTQI